MPVEETTLKPYSLYIATYGEEYAKWPLHWGIFMTLGGSGESDNFEANMEGTLFHVSPSGNEQDYKNWKFEKKPHRPATSTRVVQMFELGSYRIINLGHFITTIFKNGEEVTAQCKTDKEFNCTTWVKEMLQRLEDDQHITLAASRDVLYDELHENGMKNHDRRTQPGDFVIVKYKD
ncbi:putative PPPDE domain-containing protein [Seiridium cardinale]